MKTAIVCIAKREDYYIEEWLRYHFKLGFTDAWVFQNDWRYSGVASQFPNLKLEAADGPAQQLPVYNSFIKTHGREYDWVAFFDVDEFLCLSSNSLGSWLQKLDSQLAVAVNWRLFGSSGLQFAGDYSVLKRFTQCCPTLNHHVKTIVHMSKAKPYWDTLAFQDPHSLNMSMQTDFTSNSVGSSPVHGPFNWGFCDPDAQLNHYFCKTAEEYANKLQRGSADQTAVPNDDTMSKFRAHDENEYVDCRARDFFLKD